MIPTIRLRAALLALSISAALLTGCARSGLTPPSTQTQQTQQTQQAAQTEEAYRLRQNLRTILILGLDKFQREEQAMAYTNKMQSDFLLLAVIDEQAHTCQLLHLNRDTMTQIPRLGLGGAAAGSFVGQLALAHTYGSGGSDSSLNAVKAVSDLLGGVPIDHYMTLTMDAVGKLNDLVGGVTVTLLDDFTQLDPQMVQGREMTLTGEQALLYVRNRAELDDSSNLRRMERQRQYLQAFYQKLMEKNRSTDGFLSSALLKLNDDFASDCSISQLTQLSGLLETCTLLPILSIEGQAVAGEEFMEFYPEEESLEQTVRALFYEKTDLD